MPSVNAVMELPPPNPTICRFAEKISAMPTELIEAFIKDLPLHRVLELSLAPTAGPRLLWAVENSVAWADLFRTQPGDPGSNAPSPSRPDSSPGSRLLKLQRLYTSANLLAWNTCRTEAMNATKERGLPRHEPCCSCARDQQPIRERLSHLQVTGQSMQAHERNTFMSRLEANFVLLFADCFLQCRSQRLLSLCVFLPRDEKWVTQPHVSQDDKEMGVKPWAHYLQKPVGELTVAELASRLSHRSWTAEQAQDVSPRLFAAAESLRQAKSAELTRLADLHQRYPTILKPAFASQESSGNSKHIQSALRRDAEMVLAGVLLPSFRKSKGLRQWQRAGWCRFRYPHPNLVPYDWCLRLVRFMTEKHAIPENDSDLASSVYPSTLITDLRRSSDGLDFIHSNEFPGALRRIAPGPIQDIRHLDYRKEGPFRILPSGSGSGKVIPVAPHVLAELDWLESICRCVEWAETNVSALGIDIRMFQKVQNTKGTEVSVAPKPAFGVLSSREDYEEFIAYETPELLAQQLRADSDQCDALNPTKLPSLLALYLPAASSPRAKEISRHLLPNFEEDFQQLMYEDLIKKLQIHIRQAPELEPPSDKQQLVCDAMETRGSLAVSSQNPKNKSWKESVDRFVSSNPRLPSQKQRACYICRMQIHQKPHPTFPAMCEPCGEFNLAGSSLSLPESLDLSHKVALVTGARVNLGFHTALRLLRCGAKVIVTTRYPRDAAIRYRAEPDHEDWIERLSIFGADFRSAKDAFALVNQVKELLAQENPPGRIDILINNAAQTLTDSLAKEKTAVRRERLLEFGGEHSAPGHPLMLTPPHSYTARVRGVDPESHLLKPSTKEQTLFSESDDQSKDLDVSMSEMQLSAPAGPSSWVQSLSEIPYEDVISAHSVNTFVPLILVRELLPLLRGELQGGGQASGYIVNVSSREGIFESTATSRAKNGRHVHTNMSKAGLNMITETEAAPAWQKHRVAMNTVDPGYMSAAPEYENIYDGERPIGWEDGAGRVLWPIAMAETGQSGPIWGRFLKHYGAKRVDVRLGRG